MHSPVVPLPPRQVEVSVAARFAGTTTEAIRRYQEIGLLPEPERVNDGHRGYGYDDMIRLLWIRKMVDAGMTVDDIRDVFAEPSPAGVDGSADGDRDADGQHLRSFEGRMGLLSDFVTGRLKGLPEGSLRQADLDSLLVMERIFGSLGAAVNAGRYMALATHPGLREESDRVEAAEAALDDTVAVDDPLVAQAAAERYAFERKLDAVLEGSGQAQSDEALFDTWDALHPAAADGDAPGHGAGSGEEPVGLLEAIGMMPYDYSPARLRCMELTEELAAKQPPAS